MQHYQNVILTMISIAFAWELVKAIVEWASVKGQTKSEIKEYNFLLFSEAAWGRIFKVLFSPLSLHLLACIFIVIMHQISGSLEITLLKLLVAYILTWGVYFLYNFHWLKKYRGKAAKIMFIMLLIVTVLPFPIVALIC